MSSTRLLLLGERLSSLFRSDLRAVATRHELKLVQLEALLFLANANRYSDTPASLTDYLAVTRGTASQTLKALERRGLIEKRVDASDGRQQHCILTDAGRAVVDAVPPLEHFDGLPSEVAGPLEAHLESLLVSLQRRNGSRTFGICRTCAHFEPMARGGRCGLTKERLAVPDLALLCREHTPPA